MQRINSIYSNIYSFANLYSAYKKAYKGTKNYSSYKFAFNLEKELFILQDELKNLKYSSGNYRYFKIFKPKERTISVASFRDRVLHHALINVIEPVFEKTFIFDSYACRKEKGTHKAIKRAQFFLKKNKWFLKMDIKKYFDSIDHNTMKKLIEAKIKDKKVISLCNSIISKAGNGFQGLPIGNLTSQFFANLYLNALDHFVKDELKAKNYIRYMDDFCVFSDDKEFLKNLLIKIDNFLKEKLKLELKKNAILINTNIHGLPFLGLKIYPNLIRIKKENYKRAFNKLKKSIFAYENNYINFKKYTASTASLIAYLKTNAYNLLKSSLYANGGVLK